MSNDLAGDCRIHSVAVHNSLGELEEVLSFTGKMFSIMCANNGYIYRSASGTLFDSKKYKILPHNLSDPLGGNIHYTAHPNVKCVTLESKVVVKQIKSTSKVYILNGETEYNRHKKYSLHKGTYTFTHIHKGHPMGLDVANMNDKVSYTGQYEYHPKGKDAGVKTTGIRYYWGKLKVKVLEDFGKMAVLCGIHGQMGDQAQLLVYKTENTCIQPPKVACLNDNFTVNIKSFFPTSNASAPLAYVLNGETEYDRHKQYSLHEGGKYIFKDIPPGHPMGLDLANATRSGKVHYTGGKKHTLKPTDKGWNTGIDYYSGHLTVKVLGDFGEMAVLCGIHGLMGDQPQLLVYKNKNTC